MSYAIEIQADGHYSVTMTTPVEIARFRSEHHARLFLAKVLGVGPHGPYRDDNPVTGAGVSERATAPDDQSRRAPAAEEPTPSDTPDWDAALDRVAAGETVTDVADDMGLPMPSLRSRWANRHRGAAEEQAAETPSKPPANTVKPSPRPVKDDCPGDDVVHGPHSVARRNADWTDALDQRLLDAIRQHDDEAVWAISQETGATPQQLKRRADALMRQVAREMDT